MPVCIKMYKIQYNAGDCSEYYLQNKSIEDNASFIFNKLINWKVIRHVTPKKLVKNLDTVIIHEDCKMLKDICGQNVKILPFFYIIFNHNIKKRKLCLINFI